LRAAREAAAQAQRKARAYAEGVGAVLGPLLKLAEPEDRLTRRVGGRLRPMAAGGDASMPIEPGEHEVSAAVTATFALEPADE
jgi:uncharacterized protein YggE